MLFKQRLVAQHFLRGASGGNTFVREQNDTLACVIDEVKVMACYDLGTRQLIQHLDESAAVARIKSHRRFIKGLPRSSL